MSSKLKTNYLPEFLAFVSGRPKPSMVTVNLTSRCNQRCIYCEIGQGISSISHGSITMEDVSWILDEMKLSGIGRISLCGGEPFLFESLMDVVDYAGQRGIRCSVTTNGMTITSLQEADFLILRKYKADINLSLDSFEEEIQYLTRGVHGSVHSAIRSLEILAKENIPVTVLSAISRYNFQGLYDFVVKANSLGIRQVLFQPVIYHTNYPDRSTIEGKAALNVSPEQLDVLMQNLNDIRRFERSHLISTNVYRILPWIGPYIRSAAGQNGKWFFEEVLGAFYCREIYAAIDIAYDGGIQPCGLTRATVNIRNRDGESLLDLWLEATKEIKCNISQGKYYSYCNACCHKFSRNMMASMMNYPVKNRKAIGAMFPLIAERIGSKVRNTILKVN
jgi:MoaA/NifB/PqqE/SkfB family radical SAM enzyme